VKPKPFKYFKPHTLAHALELLSEYGDDAKVLAGGQSLVPMMNFRVVNPDVILDLNNIESLDWIELKKDCKELGLGAMVRQRTLELDQVLSEKWPIFSDAISHIGHFQIRNQGTIGGSIAHFDPAAELPALLIAMGGSVTLNNKNNSRVIQAKDFFIGPFQTVIEPDEILTGIKFSLMPETSGYSLVEISRQEGAFAMAGAISIIATDSIGNCKDVRLTLYGISDVPYVCDNVVSALVGHHPSKVDLREIVTNSTQEIDYMSDIHASKELRKHFAKVLAYRALNEGYERALKNTKQSKLYG